MDSPDWPTFATQRLPEEDHEPPHFNSTSRRVMGRPDLPDFATHRLPEEDDHEPPHFNSTSRRVMDSPDSANSTSQWPPDVEEDYQLPHALKVKHFHKVNSLIRDENIDELWKIISKEKSEPVNLMNDPVLSVVIVAKKSQLARDLIGRMSVSELKESNWIKDTPLHTAAAEGDTAVAEALLRRDWDLVNQKNLKGETPLHKAAIYGNDSMFWCLVANGNLETAPFTRSYDGSNVLHCAITANAPKLALDIARRYSALILYRNELAATPLQLMVTIPNSFRSQLVLGPFESFLYDWIVPLPEDSQSKHAAADEEDGRSVNKVAPTEDDEDVESSGWKWRSVRSKFPSQYATILDLIELTGSWLRLGAFNFLKLFSKTAKHMEELKKRHREAMELVQELARSNYNFYCLGYSGYAGSLVQRSPSTLTDNQSNDASCIADIKKILLEVVELGKEKNPPIRWNEPPLATGAKLGLDDFVRNILQVCPESATYLDSDHRNVLQVAIESGRKEVVSVLSEMLQRRNSIIPSWLCSAIDIKSTGNTILHLAAEHSPAEEGDAVQLHHEIEWFEMVEKLVPKELVNSRNKAEKTANELFTERHVETLKSCKTQLVEMGKICASLVAAVVFTSSFSIPGGGQETNEFAFKIFSHAYVIGFGCAATALVLFLSLVITPYKERDFRRAIPMQFFLACLSFGLTLAAFLLSFVCNFTLQIYSGELNTKHLIVLFLELVLFPLTCFVVLLYHGAKFTPSFTRLWK